METEKFICCICGREIEGEDGNNPWPVVDDEDAKCCDCCNSCSVVPARINMMLSHPSANTCHE